MKLIGIGNYEANASQRFANLPIESQTADRWKWKMKFFYRHFQTLKNILSISNVNRKNIFWHFLTLIQKIRFIKSFSSIARNFSIKFQYKIWPPVVGCRKAVGFDPLIGHLQSISVSWRFEPVKKFSDNESFSLMKSNSDFKLIIQLH